MSFNVVVCQCCSLTSSGRQTWGLKDRMEGDQMRGDRHLYFPHPTEIPADAGKPVAEHVGGMPRGRSEEGWGGCSGAVISSDNIIWEQTGNVLGCDVLWLERLDYAVTTVLRTGLSAFSDSHTI